MDNLNLDKLAPSIPVLLEREKRIKQLFDSVNTEDENSEGILIDDLDNYFDDEVEDYSDIVNFEEAVEDQAADRSEEDNIENLFKRFKPIYKKNLGELKKSGILNKLVCFHTQSEIKETVTEIQETTPLYQKKFRHSNRLINESSRFVASPLSHIPINNSLQPYNPPSIAVPYTNQLFNTELQALPHSLQDFIDSNRHRIAKLHVRELVFELTPTEDQPVDLARFLMVAESKDPELMNQATRTSRTTTRSCKSVSSIVHSNTRETKKIPAKRRVNNKKCYKASVTTTSHASASDSDDDPVLAKKPVRKVPNGKSRTPKGTTSKACSPSPKRDPPGIPNQSVILANHDHVNDLPPGTWFKVETNLNPTKKNSFDDSSSEDENLPPIKPKPAAVTSGSDDDDNI